MIQAVVGGLDAIAERRGWIPGAINEVELQKTVFLGAAKLILRVIKLPGLL